jgi:hypothetical protein
VSGECRGDMILYYPSFFEFRFPLAPIKHGNRNGNSLKKLAQTTIKKRAHAQLRAGSYLKRSFKPRSSFTV